MRSEISFDKVDLECAETVKSRTRINDSGFITYLNIMNFTSKWSGNSGYIINKWKIG